MTQPISPYEIRLYNQNSVFVNLLQGWSYLEYHQRVSAAWNMSLRFDLPWDDVRLTGLRAIGPDWFYLVYRTHPFSFAKGLVYEGVHQTTVDQAGEDGHIIITLYSQGYTSWLNRRVVVPGAGVDQVEKTGAAETIIKQFVDENMVTVAAPRVMPGLNIAASAGAGNTESYSARYTNLETVVQTIAEDGAVEYGIVGTNDPPTLFQFQVRPIWGTDRRINAIAGGTPMFFNYMFKNEEIPILTTNYSEQKTVVYVGGQGQGNLRTMLTLSNATALAESPRARKEAYSDAFGAETNTEMLTIGKKFLSENARRKSLTFNMRQQDNTRWLRDFYLGDIVTVKYFDHLEGKEIKEIVVRVGGQETQSIEHIDIELEDLSVAKYEWIQEWTTDYTDPYPFTDLPGEGWLVQGLQTIGAFTVDKKLWITTNFDAASPTWIMVDLAAVTGTYLIQFAVDPWSPKYQGTGTQVNGWIVSDTNIFKIDDIFGVQSLTNQYAFGYTTTRRSIDASFGTEGHVAICSIRADIAPKRIYCDWTDDKGATWNNATVITYTNSDGSDYNPGCFVSSKTPGLVFTSARYSGWHIKGYRSTDYGATWAATTGVAHSPLFFDTSHLFSSEIHFPWDDNTDEDIVYFSGGPNANADDPIFYRTTAAINITDISPTSGGLKFAPLFGRGGVSTAPLNRQKLAVIARGPHTWDGFRFFTSADAGDTWVDHGPNGYDRVHIAGDNEDVIYTWGDDCVIGYSTDFGTTIQDKRGNMVGNPAVDRIQYIVGG